MRVELHFTPQKLKYYLLTRLTGQKYLELSCHNTVTTSIYNDLGRVRTCDPLWSLKRNSFCKTGALTTRPQDRDLLRASWWIYTPREFRNNALLFSMLTGNKSAWCSWDVILALGRGMYRKFTAYVITTRYLNAAGQMFKGGARNDWAHQGSNLDQWRCQVRQWHSSWDYLIQLLYSR